MIEDRADFYFHLEELRRTIIRCVVYVLLGAVVTFIFWRDLCGLFVVPVKGLLDAGLLLVTNQPTEAFTLSIQLSLMGGLVVALPAVLVDLWAFVSPGLLPNEKKYVARGLPAVLFLFFLGVAFAYVVFPVGMRFLYSFAAAAGLKPFWSITGYLKFLLWSCLAVGAIFELPVVTGLLAMLGLVSSTFLARKRRHAIIIVLIFAAIITPSVDAITMLVVSLPMVALYEVGILVARRVEKVRKRREAAA